MGNKSEISVPLDKGHKMIMLMGEDKPPWTEYVDLCKMRDIPRSGIKPRSPALAEGFFTTEPTGKPEGASYSPILEKQFGVVDSSPQMAWVQIPV